MRQLTFSTSILVAGLAFGLLSALHMLNASGFSAVEGSPEWASFQPQKSSFGQVYSTQHFLADGSVPPPKTNLLFTRSLDDGGNQLRSDCDYEITGTPFPSRWWSLATQGEGASTASDVLVAGATLIGQDSKLIVNVSRQPQGGNWLKPPDSGNYYLSLVVNDPLGQTQLPLLKKTGC